MVRDLNTIDRLTVAFVYPPAIANQKQWTQQQPQFTCASKLWSIPRKQDYRYVTRDNLATTIIFLHELRKFSLLNWRERILLFIFAEMVLTGEGRCHRLKVVFLRDLHSFGPSRKGRTPVKATTDALFNRKCISDRWFFNSAFPSNNSIRKEKFKKSFGLQ